MMRSQRGIHVIGPIAAGRADRRFTQFKPFASNLRLDRKWLIASSSTPDLFLNHLRRVDHRHEEMEESKSAGFVTEGLTASMGELDGSRKLGKSDAKWLRISP